MRMWKTNIRLMQGKDIKPHDRTLIYHELLEMEIKRKDPTLPHWKAHEMATQIYDYQKESDAYYGSLTSNQKKSK